MHLHTPLTELTLKDAPGPRRELRDAARFMALRGAPSSPQGEALVNAVMDSVIVPAWEATGKAMRPSSRVEREVALGAMLADLIIAARDGAWTQRSEKAATFTGQPVGRTAFNAIKGSLTAAGYLERLAGFSTPPTADGFLPAQAEASCFRPTPLLIALAERHGVVLVNAGDHFRLSPLKVPDGASGDALDGDLIEARGKNTDEGKRRPVDLPDLDGRVATMRARMASLNAFLLAEGRVGGSFAFGGIRRVFSNADQPGFNWQWGGRLYSRRGWDAYEGWKGRSAARAQRITIDGEPVGEVDISACHLTLLYALSLVEFDATQDPYAIEGLDRDAVKSWIVGAIGSGKPTFGGNRLAKVRKAALAKHPVLQRLGDPAIAWPVLHYHESEVILSALERLKESDTLALPIHDGLIVPRSQLASGRRALQAAFTDYLRDELGLSITVIPKVA